MNGNFFAVAAQPGNAARVAVTVFRSEALFVHDHAVFFQRVAVRGHKGAYHVLIDTVGADFDVHTRGQVCGGFILAAAATRGRPAAAKTDTGTAAAPAVLYGEGDLRPCADPLLKGFAVNLKMQGFVKAVEGCNDLAGRQAVQLKRIAEKHHLVGRINAVQTLEFMLESVKLHIVSPLFGYKNTASGKPLTVEALCSLDVRNFGFLFTFGLVLLIEGLRKLLARIGRRNNTPLCGFTAARFLCGATGCLCHVLITSYLSRFLTHFSSSAVGFKLSILTSLVAPLTA